MIWEFGFAELCLSESSDQDAKALFSSAGVSLGGLGGWHRQVFWLSQVGSASLHSAKNFGDEPPVPPLIRAFVPDHLT